MSPNEFDRSLMEDLSQLPPAPGEVESYTPWRAAMTKILWGMGLTTFRFEFFYLQYILPLLGAALLYLGYRSLRRENRWFRLCWVLSGVLLAVHMATDILTATPVMGWITQNPALNWGLTWPLVGMQLLLLFALWRGTRAAFASVGEAEPRDWLKRGLVCYLLSLAIALWSELVPLTQDDGFFGPSILEQYEWLYYGRSIAFIALQIYLLVCIARQSGALADRGYAITPVPVRFAPTVFLGLVILVLAGSVTAALWLSSRAPALEAQPLSAVHAEEYSSVRAHLVDLGMDADLANSLDETELERCRDALAVYDLPLTHAYGEHTYNREDETGRADVEYVTLRSWAVQLPDDQVRYYLTFRWLQNPEYNIRDGLTGDPSSYDPSYDFSARILWDQDGQTWSAAPTVHLGGGETPEELPDWALEWYDYELENLGHLAYIPWCQFSFPADSENRWGWMAWSQDLTDRQDRSDDAGTLYYLSLLFYRHQVSWLHYPYYSFPQLLASSSIPRDGVTQTFGGVYELVPP